MESDRREGLSMTEARSTTPCRLLWSTVTLTMVRIAVVSAQAASAACGSVQLAVGSYTGVSWIKDPPASGEGVTFLDLELCSKQGTLSATLSKAGVVPAGDNPSYCDQLDASSIVCVNEVEEGTATIIGTNATAAAKTIELGVSKPTHVNVLAKGVVGSANFGGSFGTFKPTPGAGAVIQTVEAPGDGAHPHMILETGGAEIVVPVLNTEVVYQYNVGQAGKLTKTGTTTLPPDSGPRHAAVGKGGKVYVAAEKSLQVIELGGDCMEGAEGAARGVCGFVQLPKTFEGTTFATSAAIRVSEQQDFVYVSLREDGDGAFGAIAGVKLLPDGGLGDTVEVWKSGGSTPRDIVWVKIPGFKEVVVVANRKSDTVDVLDRDEVTGAVGTVLASAAVNTPTNVLVLAGAKGADDVSSTPASKAASAAPAAAPAAVDQPVTQPAAGSDPADTTVAAPNESGARGIDPSALSVEPSHAAVPAASMLLTVLAMCVTLAIVL